MPPPRSPALLRRVRVEAFKSIENVEVELGQVNVFIGANGSGKSNLLEALGVLGAAASGQVDAESLTRRGVRLGSAALFKTSFRDRSPRNAIHLEGHSECASYSVELLPPLGEEGLEWRFKTESLIQDNKKLVGRSPASKKESIKNTEPTQGYARLFSTTLKPENPASLHLKTLRDYAIYALETSTLRGTVPDYRPKSPVGLHGGRLPEAIQSLFKKLTKEERELLKDDQYELIDWAERVDIRRPADTPIHPSVPQTGWAIRFSDRFMARGRSMLTGYDASEGALYVLMMMVLSLHPDAPSTLAVDNFDQALHPRLARALTRKVCDWVRRTPGRQLLLTSHSPTVLDGLPLQDDEVRLFRVERSTRGRTVVSRIVIDEQVVQRAQKGLPLSQQWVMGSLGAVPNL